MWLGCVFGLLLSALTPCVAADAAADRRQQTERLQFADGLYAREMFALAAEEYEAFLRDFPDSAEAPAAAFRLAECYRRRGNAAAAEKQFARVFTRYPNSPYALKAGYLRARIFQEAGHTNAAVDLFRAVLDKGPGPDVAPAVYYALGDLLAKAGRREESRAAFTELVTRYPASDFTVYARLGLAELAVSGDPQPPDEVKVRQALDHLQAAEPLARTDRLRAEILFQRADLYFRRGDFTNSAAGFQQLAQAFPNDPRVAESRLQAAWAAHHAGRFADALRMTEEALAKAPQPDARAEWSYLKANCQRQLLQYDAALQTYDRWLAEFPSHPLADAARYEKATTALRAGRPRDAIQEAERIRTSSPELKRNLYWLLAAAHSSLSQGDRAVQYYRLLLREFPSCDLAPEAAYRLAHYLQGRGEYEEASRHFLMVVNQWTNHPLAPRALYASALNLSRAERHADAVRDWDALMRRYGRDPLAREAPYYKALSEMRLGARDSALASLQDFLAANSEGKLRPHALFWAGMLQRDAGRLREAEASLRQALQSGPNLELASQIRFHLAALVQGSGRQDEAAQLYQTLLGTELEPRLTPDLLEWLASHWLAKEDPGRAEAAAQALVLRAQDPSKKQIGLALKGQALLHAGKKTEAEDAFRQCLAIDAKTGPAAQAALHLADLALAASRYQEAAEAYHRAGETARDEADIGIRARSYIGLGKTAKAQTRYGEAAKFFMSVAILYEDPEIVPACLYEAAECFASAGDPSSAEAAWKELQDRYGKSPWAQKPRPQPRQP